MQQYVTGKAAGPSQTENARPPPETFEDDKTVTQGHFAQQFPPKIFPPLPPVKQPGSPSPRRIAISANVARSSSAAAHRPLSEAAQAGASLDRPASVNPSHLERPPFWDGSTIDGSAFSDSASNIDITERPAQRFSQSQVRHPPQSSSRKLRASHSVHSGQQSRRDGTGLSDTPFLIGDDGLIGGGPPARTAATPKIRHHKGYTEREVDRSRYSPEPGSPSSRRSRQSHTRQIVIGKGPQQVFEARPLVSVHPTSTAQRSDYAMQNPLSIVPDTRPQLVPHYGQEEEPQDEAEFASAESPVPQSATDSESENPEQEHTPKATRKVEKASSSKSAVQRQLFQDGNSAAAKSTKEHIPSLDHTMFRQGPLLMPKKRQLPPDYDDRALATMQFDKLKDEDFDFDPAKAEALSAETPQGTLEEKLQYFLGREKDTHADFFAKMSVRDWEDSGDWFLGRFGDIVQKFKEARQAKRALADQFENEVADRAETVKNKITRIDATLEGMKKEGAGMMKRDFD